MGSSEEWPAGPPGSATGHSAPRENETHSTRALLDSLEDGYFELDLAGRLTFCNRALAELLGYLPHELIGVGYQQYTDPETAQHLFRTFNRVFRTGQPVSRLGFQLTQRDGSRRAVEISVSLIRDPAQQPSGFRGVLRDISERMHSEQALKASERRYQALLTAAQRQIRERDLLDQVRALLARGLELDTVLKTVVETTAQAFGYTHVSLYLLEGDVLVLQHQVGYEHTIRYVPISQGVSGRVVRTGEPVWLVDVRADPAFLAAAEDILSEVCVPLRAQDIVIGVFNLESTGQMQLGEGDLRIALQISQHIGIALERGRLYAALRESEERFASAFEFASIGVALVSPEGRWIKVNRALCKLVGYTAEELLAKTFQDITHPDDLAADLEQVRQVLAGEIQTYQMEKRYIQPSGAVVWVLLSVSLVRDSAGTPRYFISQIQDINERKRAELAILRQNTELAALNHLGQSLNRLAEPARLLELIHTVIGQVLDNKNLYIALYDESSGSVSFPVYTVDGQHIDRPTRQYAGGLTEYVIRTRAPLFLPHDVAAGATERGVERHGRPAQCFLAVPMLVGDKVSGVIAIQDYERADVYDQGHVEILTTIAAQASIALENARLFTETRRRAEQLQAINDVERVVTTTLDLDLLSAQIAQVLHSKLNLPAVAIGLIDGDELVFKSTSATISGLKASTLSLSMFSTPMIEDCVLSGTASSLRVSGTYGERMKRGSRLTSRTSSVSPPAATRPVMPCAPTFTR
jgi:PAS domain S-box-containing protein